MSEESKIILFWVCMVCGIFSIGVGVGMLFKEGMGWLTSGILCFIMIPLGLEFNRRCLK